MPVYIAKEMGYFQQQSVDVQLNSIVNNLPALIAGDLDVVMNGTDSAVIATAQGKASPIIVHLQQHNSLSLQLASSEAGPNAKLPYPQNLKQLEGKTIATSSRGSGGDAFIHEVLAGAGMTEVKDYTIVAVGGGANIIAALKAHRVDAAMLWPPFAEQAQLEKVTVPLVEEARGQGPETRGKAAGISVVANSTFLKQHADVAKRFVAAVVEAEAFNRDYAKNKDKLIEIAAKYTGVTDKQVLAAAIESEAKIAYPGVTCDGLAWTAKGLIEVGTIKTAPACDQMVAQGIAPTGPTGP